MASPPRNRLTSELSPDAPAWFRERVLPAIQAFSGDAAGALDKGLSFSDNFAGCVATARIRMPTTAPYPRAWARCALTSPQTVASGSFQVVQYGSTEFDNRGLIEGAGTSGWKFRCDEDATYAVHGMATFEAGTAGILVLSVFKNGVEFGRLCEVNPMGTGKLGAGGSTLIELEADDYLDVRVFQNAGVTRELNGNRLSNHASVQQLSDSPERIVPDCFPIPFKAVVNGKPFRPRLVLLGHLTDEVGGEPVTDGPVGHPLWDWDGTDRVRILDLPGLAYGHSYDATFVALAG